MSALDVVLSEIEAFFLRFPLEPWDRVTLAPQAAGAIDNLEAACGRSLPTDLEQFLRRGFQIGLVSFDPDPQTEYDEAQRRDSGFGGLEVLLTAEEMAEEVPRDRNFAADYDYPELLASVRVFDVRPHYRVRLADGAVLLETDNGPVELASSLTSFFARWLQIGCFRGHDYVTYARGLAARYQWIAPRPQDAPLLKIHDQIFRSNFASL